ncbi:UNVERIFIED_CONTAM: hypothetical protein Sradi_3657000 [Sesamum radiatum]|uniref:Reverse transcriptase Ty1/copia-type domain-containing protein n=1 Tax=Sesamum radiatum TaxID=300843 RepID=A0AAW2QIN1_SESRA
MMVQLKDASWPLHQLDVNYAFFHGYLDEEIYMQAPEGYPIQSGHVCKLQKSLYSYALGLQIAKSSTGTSLTQAKYVQDILSDTGLQNAKAATTSLPQGIKLCATREAALSDPEPYRRLAGYLLYLGFTMPDISYGVQQLSQFLQLLCEGHWQTALNVVRYLKGTSNTSLLSLRLTPSLSRPIEMPTGLHAWILGGRLLVSVYF